MSARRAWRAASAALLAIGVSAHAGQARPITVEDVLGVEEFGRIAFADEGRTLVVTHARAMRDAGRYGWSTNALARDIYRYRVLGFATATGRETGMFALPGGQGAKLVDVSPDGREVLLATAIDDILRLAWWRPSKGAQGLLGPAPSTEGGVWPRWSADNRLVYADMPGALSATHLFAARAADTEAMAAGTGVTASVIGTGRFRAEPEGFGLVAGGAGGQDVRRIASGRYWQAAAAPGWIAALRGEARPLDVDAPLGENSFMRLQLQVFRAAGSKTVPVLPCGACDVIAGSMAWSISGARLAFASVEADAPGKAALWTFAPGTRRLERISLAAATMVLSPTGPIQDIGYPRIAWIGDRLAVLGRTDGGEQCWFLERSVGRFDRWVCGGGAGSMLAAGPRGAIVQEASGGIVRLAPDGAQVRLSPGVGAVLSPWSDGRERPVFSGSGAPGNARYLIFTSNRSETSDGRIWLLDTLTEHWSGIALPAGAALRAVSPESRQAAVTRRVGNETQLLLLGTGALPREVMRLNPGLADVELGERVPVRHAGPAGETLTSWLILPPGYRGGRLPLIVELYPGAAQNPERYGGYDITTFNPMQDELLAATGYAVLVPSVLASRSVAANPLAGVTDQLMRALDAAIATGRIDPDRIALQGHSFGGYATLGVLAETDRFKAAVALSPVSDLIGQWGSFPSGNAALQAAHGLELFAPGSVESDQSAMGAPPWRDAERYVRGSPLFRAETINTPLMLIHGSADAAVPPAQSQEMMTALARANKDAVLVEYAGEGHILARSPENLRDMWKRILSWYESHLRR